MVAPNEFFEETEKMMLAQIVTSWGVSVKDQESFDDYCHTLSLALDHDEMTRILAMAVAVVSSISRGVVTQLATIVEEMEARGN